jgi:diguanylate cyclase (GGDEF)-like protein
MSGIARGTELGLVAVGPRGTAGARDNVQVTSTPDPAFLDYLTNLPTRAVFGRSLGEYCAGVGAGLGSLAVLVVDLDRFKTVNDTLGHPIGDTLLRTVAERLQSAVRSGDLVCRIGGDEFAILQMHAAADDAAAAAGRIVDLLKRPFLLQGHLLNIGASVGIALAPRDSADPDKLLMQADLALYQAKKNGRGNFSFFRPELQERAEARRVLEGELRRALMLRQYELHYQPQIDVGTGKLTGFEALLRWRHPKQGILSPASFVPLLEELGLMLPVGDWVLRTACAEAMQWPGELSVSVNVAGSQFESDRLLPAVAGALTSSGLQPHRLEVEVTEAALLHHGAAARDALRRLRELGVRIAMDEFGSGYSTISQLRTFSFDRIKMDRSFVGSPAANRHDAAIVRTIAGLGQALGMRTTAEGIETAEQLEQIRAHGCTEVQGYFVGRPVAAHELEAVITALGDAGIARRTEGAAQEPVEAVAA